MTERQSIPSLSEARSVLREARLRATPCRVAVVRYLAAKQSPASHQDVCGELEDRGFDKSTIFRTLNDLAECGLAFRMELGDHVWRYELKPLNTPAAAQDEDELATLHPHLLCTDCGQIQCLNSGEVQVQVADEVGSVSEVLLKGLCRSCMQD